MSSVGIYIVIAYTATGFVAIGALHFVFRKRPWKWVVSLLLLIGVAALAAVPFIEEDGIATQFAEVCKNAGVVVVRKVQAEGFYDSTMQSGFAHIDQRGFAFMEHRSTSKKVEHIEKADGKWKTTTLDAPTARYRLMQLRSNERVGHRVFMDEQVVQDSQSGEVIARNTTFSRHPNTIDQQWAGQFGSVVTFCPDPAKGSPQPSFVDQVIAPIAR